MRARIERRAQDVGFRTFGLMRFSTVSFGNTSLAERKLRLPDFAQHTPVADIFVQPDFYYQRGSIPGICIFIDGPYHDTLARREEDQRGREALEDRGHRVIAVNADQSLAEQIRRHPDVFDPM